MAQQKGKTLVNGERQLGRYTVVILRYSAFSDSWNPDVMPLDATVTNYRLKLRPFQKKYKPATIPTSYVSAIEKRTLGRFHCVQLTLITGHLLCLMLSTGKLENLYDDLAAMKLPPPKFRFDEKIARDDIQRLITFFGKMPQADTTTKPVNNP